MNESRMLIILWCIILFFPLSITKDILIVFLICSVIQYILKEVLQFIKDIKKK